MKKTEDSSNESQIALNQELFINVEASLPQNVIGNLNDGADVNFMENDFFAPLHILGSVHDLFIETYSDTDEENKACQEKLDNALLAQSKITEFLLQKKPIVNMRNAVNNTPLHYAAAGHFNVLVQRKIDKNQSTFINIKHVEYHQLVNTLLRYNADPNASNQHGKTPLFQAVEKNHLQSSEWLLKFKTDINHQDNNGETALHHAASNGHLEMVALLCRYQARADVQSNNHYTPIHLVRGEESKTILTMLAKHVAASYQDDCPYALTIFNAVKEGQLHTLSLSDIEAIDAQDTFGFTLLHWAVLFNQPLAVKKLLALNANPLLSDCAGLCPIEWAAKTNQYESVGYFMSKVSGIERAKPFIDKAFATAITLNHIETVETFLECGANPNAEVETVGLLHLASRLEDTRPAAYLIGYKADVNAVNSQNFSPIHVAAKNGYPAMIDLFIEQKADFIPCENRHSPLLWAAGYNTHGTAKQLFEKQPYDSRKTYGYSMLHCAAQYGNTENVRDLIELGHPIDGRDARGCTPLHLAAGNGKIGAVKTLLNYKANIEAKTNQGNTVLILAIKANADSVVNELILAGANPNQVSNHGHPPLYHAVVAKNSKIIQALMNPLRHHKRKTSLAPRYAKELKKHGFFNQTEIQEMSNSEHRLNENMTITQYAYQQTDFKTLKTMVKNGAFFDPPTKSSLSDEQKEKLQKAAIAYRQAKAKALSNQQRIASNRWPVHKALFFQHTQTDSPLARLPKEILWRIAAYDNSQCMRELSAEIANRFAEAEVEARSAEEHSHSTKNCSLM